MAKQPSTRKISGEVKPAFDVEAVPAKAEGSITQFVCPGAQRLLMLFTDSKKMVVNGEVVTTPAITVQFDQWRYDCTDPEIEALIRKSARFKSGEIRDVAEMERASLNRKVKEVVEAMQNEAVAAGVQAHLQRAATFAPTVAVEQ